MTGRFWRRRRSSPGSIVPISATTMTRAGISAQPSSGRMHADATSPCILVRWTIRRSLLPSGSISTPALTSIFPGIGDACLRRAPGKPSIERAAFSPSWPSSAATSISPGSTRHSSTGTRSPSHRSAYDRSSRRKRWSRSSTCMHGANTFRPHASALSHGPVDRRLWWQATASDARRIGRRAFRRRSSRRS